MNLSDNFHFYVDFKLFVNATFYLMVMQHDILVIK